MGIIEERLTRYEVRKQRRQNLVAAVIRMHKERYRTKESIAGVLGVKESTVDNILKEYKKKEK